MGTYNCSDFRKGLKVQIDGVPYLMVEMNFRKPGKGNALYEVRLKNLIRGTTLDRVYKGGDTLEAADCEETEVQYLYRQQDTFVFMDNKSFEQHEIPSEKVDESVKYLKEGMPCTMMLFNGLPISITPPAHVELKVVETDPGVRGDTATGGGKPAKLETGAVVRVPLFINEGETIRVDTRTGEYLSRGKA